MKLKQLILSAIMLAASAGAQATVYDIGTLPAGYTGFGSYSVSGTFLDTINFSLADPAIGGFVAGALNFSVGRKPILNISDLSLSLFDSADNILGSGLDFTINSLDAGNYYLQVSGVTNGLFGGIYAGGINVSPVPESDIWSLLVAGLAMIGFMAFRRRDMH